MKIEVCARPCEGRYSIEPHGDGFVLYYGRCGCQHGFNLVYLTEPAKNCDLVLLEYLLNLGLEEDRKRELES